MKKTKVHFYRETPHVQNLGCVKTPANLAPCQPGDLASRHNNLRCLTSDTMTFGALTACLATQFFDRGLTARRKAIGTRVPRLSRAACFDGRLTAVTNHERLREKSSW